MEEKVRELVGRFFEWDSKEVTSIFQELLLGMEAEAGLPPGGLMSRNYDTAIDC